MSIDERTRLRIRQWFVDQMDDEEMVRAIMESMPPVEWADVATKSDVALLGRELRTEMGELRIEIRDQIANVKADVGTVRGEISELRGEMSGLRGEMSELRGEIGGEISELRGEMSGLRGEMSGLRGEMSGLRGELRSDLASFLRTMVFMMIGFALTIWISLLVA